MGEVRSSATIVNEGRFIWYGHRHIQEISGKTTTYTSFAQRFLPPKEPETFATRQRRHIARIAGIALLGTAVAAIGRVLAIAIPSAAINAVFLVAVAYLCVFAALVMSGWLRRRTEHASEGYQRTMRKWEALYYCGECGKVSTLNGRHCFEPEKVQAYIRN